MKQMNIKKKHNIDGHQFYEAVLNNAIAIFWEDNETITMPILRVDENHRGKGFGKKLFIELENYAKSKGKIFQISDAPENIKSMHSIMKGYKKKEFTRDNWKKEDTVAMYRKDGDNIHYDLKTLVKKHLLIYAYFNNEPEEKLDRCCICLSDLDKNYYVCPKCGLCLRCQCISFSKNACHLCSNGLNELKKNQVCKRRVVKF